MPHPASWEATVPVEAYGDHELEWELTNTRHGARCHVWVRWRGAHLFIVSAESARRGSPAVEERMREVALQLARARLDASDFQPRAHYRYRGVL